MIRRGEYLFDSIVSAEIIHNPACKGCTVVPKKFFWTAMKRDETSIKNINSYFGCSSRNGYCIHPPLSGKGPKKSIDTIPYG
ncbi:hypothetical protein AYI68_g7541 [Smittium mucronatum]|uniref:Uncharacterized protein n=1 Tax=Smittium mucronatum TaxID=133383 RepID=A0A1R0GNE6_9FUNG|nr:hypothetical protein AYI68_g7541 [Smittium mucronatum]